MAWALNHHLDEAIVDHTAAIALAPRNADAYLHRGLVWEQKNELDKALEDYSESLKIDSMNFVVFGARANLWMRKGEFEKALTDLTAAIRLNPTDAHSYNERAWLHATCPVESCRDGKRAVTDAVEACMLDRWQNWLFVDTLAAAYAENGEFDNAVKWQQRATEMAPDANTKERTAARLKLYQEHQPYREPQKSAGADAAGEDKGK